MEFCLLCSNPIVVRKRPSDHEYHRESLCLGVEIVVQYFSESKYKQHTYPAEPHTGEFPWQRPIRLFILYLYYRVIWTLSPGQKVHPTQAKLQNRNLHRRVGDQTVLPSGASNKTIQLFDYDMGRKFELDQMQANSIQLHSQLSSQVGCQTIPNSIQVANVARVAWVGSTVWPRAFVV